MLVYRCEDHNHVGPFNSREISYDEAYHALSHAWSGMYPFNPYWGPSADYKVGCQKKRYFQAWFPKQSRAKLAKYGFKLVIFDVPETYVEKGHNQVAFKRDDKFKVAELDLDTPVKDWYAKPATIGEAQ